MSPPSSLPTVKSNGEVISEESKSPMSPTGSEVGNSNTAGNRLSRLFSLRRSFGPGKDYI